MHRSDWTAVLDVVAPAALGYLDSLPGSPGVPEGGYDAIRAALDHGLPDAGLDPVQVVAELARDLTPYVTAMASGRFFGFVIGGLHPASWGAELLVSTWDQNAGLFPPTPGVAVAEELAGEWLLDLLRLPADSSVGFVTGGQMANFTCLAAARDQVLRDVGWDVEADGLTALRRSPWCSRKACTRRAARAALPRARRAVRGVRAVRRPGPVLPAAWPTS
jgi:hypothetical protein